MFFQNLAPSRGVILGGFLSSVGFPGAAQIPLSDLISTEKSLFNGSRWT